MTCKICGIESENGTLAWVADVWNEEEADIIFSQQPSFRVYEYCVHPEIEGETYPDYAWVTIMHNGLTSSVHQGRLRFDKQTAIDEVISALNKEIDSFVGYRDRILSGKTDPVQRKEETDAGDY